MYRLFGHRFRRWRRRRAKVLVSAVLVAVVTATVLVISVEYLDRTGGRDEPVSKVFQANLPLQIGAPADTGKLTERMEAATKAELQTQVGSDLSVLPVLEVPPPLQSIDGTSFRVGADIIRIEAVSGPTAAAICRDGIMLWSCGLWARAGLHNLVAGRSLFCQPRRIHADGAIGADCQLQARKALPGGDVARLLVRQGWARPLSTRRPEFAAELSEAEALRAGLWRGEWTVAMP